MKYLIGQLDKTFSLLECHLPSGWVSTFDKHKKKVLILGPSGAKITIADLKKGKLSVTGGWPKNSSGNAMDPYAWGVLDYYDDYPLIKWDVTKRSENKAHGVLEYLCDYHSVYLKCLTKASHQVHAH